MNPKATGIPEKQWGATEKHWVATEKGTEVILRSIDAGTEGTKVLLRSTVVATEVTRSTNVASVGSAVLLRSRKGFYCWNKDEIKKKVTFNFFSKSLKIIVNF